MLNTVVWSQKVLDWSGAKKRHVTHHETIADESLYNGPDAPLPGADTSGWKWDEDAVDKKAFISCSFSICSGMFRGVTEMHMNIIE